MKTRMMKGAAVALFAAMTGAAGTVSAIPPVGTCTPENEGQRVTETHWSGSSGIYQCEAGVWVTYAICDNRGRCTVVI